MHTVTCKLASVQLGQVHDCAWTDALSNARMLLIARHAHAHTLVDDAVAHAHISFDHGEGGGSGLGPW
eukprot:6178358-Pleurochrysis_carterae.AAC.3